VAYGLLVRYCRISKPREGLRGQSIKKRMSTPEHHKFMQQVRQDKVQRKKLGVQERMAEGRAANLARKSGKGYKK
jgi:hypothetical protein